MKTKMNFLKNASRIFTIAVCVCSVAFFASCGGDDPEPDPTVTSGISNVKVSKLNDRTIANPAGQLNYTDKVTVSADVATTTGDKKETKNETVDQTFEVKSAWSATAITISALTGDIKKPTITTVANNAGLTFDFGGFKAESAVKFTNPSYNFQKDGKSGAMEFYGFNGGEAVGDPVVVVKTVTEGTKNYTVTTVTQKFKVKSSDGVLSAEQTIVFENKVEVTVKPTVTEKSFKSTKTSTEDSGVTSSYVAFYSHEYKLSVNDGAGAKDVDVSQEGIGQIHLGSNKVQWYSSSLTISLQIEEREQYETWQIVSGLYDGRLEKSKLTYDFQASNFGSKVGIAVVSSNVFRYKVVDGEYIDLSALTIKYLETVSITYGEQQTGEPAGTGLGEVVYKEAQVTFKVQLGEEVITRTRNFVVYHNK